jgi:diaminopimelate epimerase
MERALKFKKYSGAGNDFIMINNYTDKHGLDYNKLAKKMCPRGLSVGADGLIVIEPANNHDFKMRYFNSDGSEAEMCGNGGRCVSMFAYREKIVGKQMTFETIAGIYSSEIINDNVRLKMLPPQKWTKYIIKYKSDNIAGTFLNTGVPHFVTFYCSDEDIVPLGKFIRFHKYFSPEGTNVDFVKIIDNHKLKIRTYERGVENETLACGTGSVASAVVAIVNGSVHSPVDIVTKSGIILTVEVEFSNDKIRSLYLTGDAREVYCGKFKV